MKKEAINFILAIVFLVLSAGFIYGCKNINVDKVGPNKVEVGYSSINEKVFNKLGKNDKYDKISDYLLYEAMATVGIFGVIGLYQLIRRKSLLKIDGDIWMLAWYYVLVVAVYVGFDKLSINLRPILTEKGAEPSFPSSHTLITFCFLGVTMIQASDRVRKKALRWFINIVCIGSMLAMPILRLLAGMHWFSDVVGGIIIGHVFVLAYKAFYLRHRRKNDKFEGLSFVDED